MGFFADWIAPIGTIDFWQRTLTRPLDAVFDHPLLAAKSAAVAGGAALVVGSGVLAAKAAAVAAGKVSAVAANLAIVANATAPVVAGTSILSTGLKVATVGAFFGGAVAEQQRLSLQGRRQSRGIDISAFFRFR